MKAVIVAGGMGTRLLPITEKIPKCLVPVNNLPIINYQLDILVKNNIRDVAIVIGHFGDQVIKHTQELYSDRINFHYIENKDYMITQNAYSLWLARDFLIEDKDGFVIFNSDLLFSEGMFSTLINSPHKDGMIVDECQEITTDMVKIELEGEKIIQMNKKLDNGITSAEAVGPVKFSKEGGEKFFNFLSDYFTRVDRKNWLFYMLGDFGKEHDFLAIKNPGFVWAEVDNTEDLKVAEEKISDIVG